MRCWIWWSGGKGPCADDPPLTYLNEVTLGDCRELSRAIPDNSIDLVFTDPPYPAEYLPLYEWLGKEAKRVLKPGGYLFAYCGGHHLPDYLNAIQSGGLIFYWLDTLWNNGGTPRMQGYNLTVICKFCSVFCNGWPDRRPWRDTAWTGHIDKTFHHWGQPIGYPLKIISLYTDPGQVVYDPFCGGGTTAAAAYQLGRQFITFEIDPKAHATSTRRLQEQTLPMIVPARETMKALI